LVGLSVAIAPLSGQGALAQEVGPKRFETDLGNLESAVERLSKTYDNPLAVLRKFPNQKRLLDARIFFELQQYENAAMLLFDVLERPDFQTDLEFEATQLLLGECLLKVDNPRGARELFRRVSKGRDRALAEEARLLLLEIALTDGSDAALREAVNDMGQNASSDRTRYGLGKARLRLGDFDQAISWLQVIPPQSELYHRARFYLGAAYIAKGQTDLGLEVFRALTAIQGTDPLTQELRDQAWLAVGRLLVERGATDLALTSYQNIDRNSPHYEDAVYEMSWAYVNQEKYDKALQTVEVLLLTVENDQKEIDAYVLRGRLNVMMQEYDEALGSYQNILDRFAPIRNELARFTKNPEEVQKYFRWLLDRRSGLADLKSPLSDKTVKWLESTADFSGVATVFDRIAAERQDIEEAQHLGEELSGMLSGNNRVEMFPELRQGWSKALVLENRLVLLATEMLDLQNERIRDRLGEREKAELAELVAWRRKLEAQAARLPTTYDAYEARQEAVLQRYREIEKKHFMVEQTIEEVQRQLKAIETYLNDKQYADDGKKMPAEREAGLRKDIEGEKVELTSMYNDLLELKREIQRDLGAVGTGDEATRGEDNLKASLLDALEREGNFYDGVGARGGGTIAKDFEVFGGLRGRVVRAIGRLDGVISAIDKEVGTKTAELVELVRRESKNLASYDGEVEVYEGEGRAIAMRLGEEFFARAMSTMDMVVLDADVGLLDVVWARKSEKTQELQRINDDRARRIRQLQQDLDSIKSGAADEVSEQVAPPPPTAPAAEETTP
jgi:tetratricopeptide (TPR) repeat protein